MTKVTKEVFKPEIVEAIADFIVTKKCVEEMSDDDARASLVTEHLFRSGEFSDDGKYAILREISNGRIMGAMIRGYEAEKTPEEKVHEVYLEAYKGAHGVIDTQYYVGITTGVYKTLEALGVTVEDIYEGKR